METMASRPFSFYQVLCERNEPIRTYRSVHARLFEHAPAQSRKKTRENYTIAPMAIQKTEDELAAVVAIFVQFPENEESPWNLAVGSAVVQVNPQQLLQVTTYGQGAGKSTTRFTNTVASW